MGAPYPAKGIANAFLQRSFNGREKIEPMKLQKLVYLAHGYYLAATKGNPLINEAFEAWKYGPVVPSLYHEFKHCGAQPISELATEVDFEKFDFEPVAAPESDKLVRDVIDFVWDTYKGWSGLKLSDLSHKPGWAWERTRTKHTINLLNQDIDNQEIFSDFRALVKPTASA